MKLIHNEEILRKWEWIAESLYEIQQEVEDQEDVDILDELIQKAIMMDELMIEEYGEHNHTKEWADDWIHEVFRSAYQPTDVLDVMATISYCNACEENMGAVLPECDKCPVKDAFGECNEDNSMFDYMYESLKGVILRNFESEL